MRQVNGIPGKEELQISMDQLFGIEFPGIGFPGIPPVLGAAPGNIFNIHGAFDVLRTARYGCYGHCNCKSQRLAG